MTRPPAWADTAEEADAWSTDIDDAQDEAHDRERDAEEDARLERIERRWSA